MMTKIKGKLSIILGMECDNVLVKKLHTKAKSPSFMFNWLIQAEYVLVMLENGKTMASMKEQLTEVTGEEPADVFCQWWVLVTHRFLFLLTNYECAGSTQFLPTRRNLAKVRCNVLQIDAD